MAYMSQEKKKLIAEALKKVVPAGWKYSLAVDNHSTIVMTIAEAPVDIIAEANEKNRQLAEWRGMVPHVIKGHFEINHYHFDASDYPQSGQVLAAILKALNDGNHDRSDRMSDYFDVGWYVSLRVGRYNKPFVNTAAQEVA